MKSGSGQLKRREDTELKRIKLGQRVYRRLMKRVLQRGGCRCQKCGSVQILQVRHQIKRSQMGDESLEDLVTLCAYCYLHEHRRLFYTVPAIRICRKPEPRGR